MTDSTEITNTENAEKIENPTEVAATSENSATAETTETSEAVTETQPTTNAENSENSETSEIAATAETSETTEAPATNENTTATPEVTAAADTPVEATAEPKLCGTDPKIICDVVHELFQEPKPKEEPKPEEPTRSLEFQTTRKVSETVVPKVPVQYVENPLKFAKDLKKPTALDKIKDVAANLKLMGKEAEGEFIVKAFDNITNPTLERKEFEIKDTEELAKAFFGRENIEPKEPGALHSAKFAIEESNNMHKVHTFQDSHSGTVTDKVIDSAYGTIAAQVNFDMISELRERVYHAKFELDKVVGVKGELFDSLNCSLKKAEEILNVERKNIVMHNLQEITKVLEAVKVEELAPEDRKALWDAIHNLKCANNLVNKAGFKDKAGDNEKIVQEHVAKALKLYPKLKEDVRMQALSSQIFALSE